MDKRIKALSLCLTVIIALLPFSFLLSINASSFEYLGSVAECRIVGDKIIVSGSIKHSVLVSNRDSLIAVYKLLPWENADLVIDTTEPIKQTNMSISFDFELPCLTIADKTSMYVVALIDNDGEARCISEPKFPDAVMADTSNMGFKGVKSDNTALSLASHAGSAIIDVYLDKLDNGNKSGHIFNADGDIYYFDRDLIQQLDRRILSYTAMGCEVLLRFLISPGVTNIPFCSDGRIWSTNKCVVVDDVSALNAIYGYTYFLMSRYDGGDFGRVNGIILGRGADMPILYNYASLVSEDYDTVYARSLALIGLAASDAGGDGNVSLIVPIGDSLAGKKSIYAEKFLSSVADYIAVHSEMTFTVMCESMHNPYHINDLMFGVSTPSDETGEDGDAITYPETESKSDATVTDVVMEETVTMTADTFADTTMDIIHSGTDVIGDDDYIMLDDTLSAPEVSALPNDTSPDLESVKPYINTADDGFYCTDSIDIFIEAFDKLKKKYSSLNKGFAWCWYPDSNTIEGSLGVCYSYNYMRLASEGVDFFVVAFEGEAYDRLSSISHLFKYIDTSYNIEETEYAREIFEIEDWSDIIKNYDRSTGIFGVLVESKLQHNITDYTGKLMYMDYAHSNNVGGWYEGVFCDSIAHHTENGEGFLQANLALDVSGLYQSEIGYIFNKAEPLLVADSLTFDVMCGEDDGSLYEISVYINCDNNTVVSKSVIEGGVRTSLSVDAKDIYNGSAVESLRIALTRITGRGACKLNLYSISINSETLDDDSLNKNFQSIRDDLRSDSEPDDANRSLKTIVIVILLSSVALFSMLFAFANDRRLLKNATVDNINHLNEKETENERH